MKILMVETKKGSPDGINISEFAKGKEYDLPPGLADVFIHEGWAKIVEEKLEKKIIKVKEKQVIKRKEKKH